MEEEDDIIKYISNSEKESGSSDNDIEDNYINRKIDKMSDEHEEGNFNNKLINAFKSKEVKESISSIFESCFIWGKSKLKRKKNLKRFVCDSEVSEEEYEVEKENTKGERKKIIKYRKNKSIQKIKTNKDNKIL